MNKNDVPDINITLTEALIRITAIEKVLISKNLITEEDLFKEIKVLSDTLIQTIKNNLSS